MGVTRVERCVTTEGVGGGGTHKWTSDQASLVLYSTVTIKKCRHLLWLQWAKVPRGGLSYKVAWMLVLNLLTKRSQWRLSTKITSWQGLLRLDNQFFRFLHICGLLWNRTLLRGQNLARVTNYNVLLPGRGESESRLDFQPLFRENEPAVIPPRRNEDRTRWERLYITIVVSYRSILPLGTRVTAAFLVQHTFLLDLC